jgi:hypothetical protein
MMKEYSVLVFERDYYLAQILEGILENELRDYSLSIRTVSDFPALNNELTTNQYDVLVTDLLDWKEDDFNSFRSVRKTFPSLRVVLTGNRRNAPDDIAEASNTVITPRLSTRISKTVLEMLLGSACEQS